MYAAPANVSVYPKGDSKGIQVVAFDMDLGEQLLNLCGRGSATKTIDPSVWNLPEDSLRAFVEGYFAGDGGRVRTYLQAKTVSRDIASQMRFLGEMLGYKVELQWYPPEPGEIQGRVFKHTNPVYILRMSDCNRTLGARKPSKPTILEHNGTDFTLAYVKSVHRVLYVGDVMNLSVEGSPTFQTSVGMSHNTVKSLKLMRYLIRLVTPKGGIVLDPFSGSGSTLVAALQEGMSFVGIEREAEYTRISSERVRFVAAEELAQRRDRETFKLLEELDQEF